MIDPQYMYDNSGNKIGVFLAIDDWNEISRIPEIEDMSLSSIPDWQVTLVKKELDNLSMGKADLMNWEEARKQFKL